jgi:hypothetical protein
VRSLDLLERISYSLVQLKIPISGYMSTLLQSLARCNFRAHTMQDEPRLLQVFGGLQYLAYLILSRERPSIDEYQRRRIFAEEVPSHIKHHFEAEIVEYSICSGGNKAARMSSLLSTVPPQRALTAFAKVVFPEPGRPAIRMIMELGAA